MKPNVNLPQLFPFKKELQDLIQQLLIIIAPDAIYLSSVRKEPTQLYALHLVVNSANEPSKEELDLLKQIDEKSPQFYLQWSTASQIRKSLMAGEIYYLKQCYYGEIVYLREDSKDPLANTTFKGTTLLTKIEEKTEHDFNDFVELFSITYDHFQNENYYKATREITSILVKLFNYAETLFKGKTINGISLSDNVKYLAVLYPEFQKLFDPDNDKITEILGFLDDVDGLDSKEHKIYRSECHQMFVLGEVVFQIVHDIARGILSTCQNLEKLRNPSKSILISGENLQLPFELTLQEVLDFLRSEFKVHSVFLISKEQHSIFEKQNFQKTEECQYHRFRCTLLLVTKKPVSLTSAELMDRVFNHTGKRMKVFFIFETFPKILDKLNHGNNFLDRVLRKQNSIFQTDQQLFKFLDGKPTYYPQSWQQINKRWKSRIGRANYLLDLAYVIDLEEDLLANLVLIQNALVQSCIGMLNVFWEYQPSCISLPYLIQLCSTFCDFPRDILLNTSFESQRMYYLITHAQQHINYNYPFKISEKDTEKAYHLCNKFITEAEKITERKLAYLKMKSFQRNKPLQYKTT